MTALLEEHAVALQLHRVLSEIDPVRWRDEKASALRTRLSEIQARLEALRQASSPHPIAEALKAELPALEAPGAELKGRWLAFKQRLQPAYQALAAELKKESIHLPSLRPSNYARNVLHVASAAFAVGCIEFLPTWAMVAVAGGWALWAWSAETARRFSPRVNALIMRVFNPVAHPHEVLKVNSATWYATAMLLLALTGSSALCLVGVVVLGVGDPIAAIIGKRFGRIRLAYGRSLEGSLAFVVSATVVTFAMLRVFHAGSMGSGAALIVAASTALAGAIAELVSLRVDDNFSIPLAAAAGGAVALWASGLPIP